MPNNFFAKNILFLRKRERLNQAEMLDRTGIKGATWSNYENDISEPSISVLLNISDFFGVTLDELLTIELSDSYLNAKSGHIENKGKIQPKPIPNVRPNRVNYSTTEHVNSMVSEPDPVKDWTFVTVLKEMDRKLDQLLVLNKPKGKKGTY